MDLPVKSRHGNSAGGLGKVFPSIGENIDPVDLKSTKIAKRLVVKFRGLDCHAAVRTNDR